MIIFFNIKRSCVLGEWTSNAVAQNNKQWSVPTTKQMDNGNIRNRPSPSSVSKEAFSQVMCSTIEGKFVLGKWEMNIGC
jgi:hypothetical protein